MDSNSSPDVYSYRKLENDTTIRVLVLQPAKDHESMLVANLVHTDRHQLFSITNIVQHSTSVPTKQCLKWECVSYAWGHLQFSRNLYVDGRIIKITANVESMLRYLRKSTKARLLWVDAICLNQTDSIEKAVQVSLMGEIFSQANKVHIWLGEETHIADLQKVILFFQSMAVAKDRKTAKDTPRVNIVHSIPGVFQLLEQPWFQRRWVLQEVCLGHNVTARCGSFKIAWDWLAEGIMALGSKFIDMCFRESHINAIAQVVSLRQGRAPILDLLSRYHVAQSSDRRDSIFALCGMATDIVFIPDGGTYIERLGGHNKFSVDYSKSWVSTYSEFAHAHVELGNTPFLLENAISFGSLTAFSEQYPSWVPDWSANRKWAHRFTILPGADNEFFNPRVLNTGDEMILKLWGELYGPVCFTEDSNRPQTFHMTINDIVSFIHLLTTSHDTSVLTSAIIDAHIDFSNSRFSRNSIELSEILFGILPTPSELGLLASAYKECVQRIDSAIAYHFDKTSSRSKSKPQETSRSMEPPFEAVRQLLKDRKAFYVTSQEFRILGIGPPEMESGDFVFRLPSLYPETAAFVVRPVSNALQNQRFRLIGLCFFAKGKTLPTVCTTKEIMLI